MTDASERTGFQPPGASENLKWERGVCLLIFLCLGCRSLTVRILEVIGCAVGFLMLYVVTGLELNESNHIVMPLLGTTYGVSVVIGPALSGFLFDPGSYPLPVLAMGSALLTLMIVAASIFRELPPRTAEERAA